MASGDIVNSVGLGTGTTITFQPAATVSICITSLGSNGGWCFLYNGTTQAHHCMGPDQSISTACNTKVMIDNTNYLQITPNGVSASYSGIQIQ
jgi:aspartate oxidase